MSSDFETRADAVLEHLMDSVEDAYDDLDADVQAGILTIEFDDGRQFVINKHGPSQEIWMSSPMSGAHHFAYDQAAGVWKNTRSDSELLSQLSDELFKLTGVRADFSL